MTIIAGVFMAVLAEINTTIVKNARIKFKFKKYSKFNCLTFELVD